MLAPYLLTHETLRSSILGLLIPPGGAAQLLVDEEVVVVGEEVQDVAAAYKKNCIACHGPKADKAYDPNMPEEEQIEIILKGKKMEKPPHMPGYESRGMKADEAKALVEYMRSLRQSAD